MTLVVPNFNHACYLPQSLSSIAAQTRAPDRVLIIDDASTDDSLAVISRFVAEHPTWELIRHDVNTGVMVGQNAALRTTETDWIGFLGADDALHPTYLERTLLQAASFPEAGLICACTEIIGSSQRRALRPIILPERRSAYLAPADVRKKLLAGDNYFSGTVSLYRRDALLALGGFDERIGSIADGLRARELALRFGFCFVPEILGYWRIHEHNFSTATVTDPVVLSARLAEVRASVAGNGVFPPGYADLFERRTRFGAARIVILADRPASAKAKRVAALLRFGAVERSWLRLLLSFGALGKIAALAWATLRTRPMSLARVLGQISARRAIVAAHYLSTRTTNLSAIASLRHRLNRFEAGELRSCPRAGLPAKPKGSPLARLTGLAFRLYGFLSARRKLLLPLATRASAVMKRHVIGAPVGVALLRVTDREIARSSRLALPAAQLIALALASAAYIHLSASQKSRALRAARLLNMIFRARVRSRSGFVPLVYFSTLALCGAYDRIVREVPQAEAIGSFPVNFAVGLAHMYRGNYPCALHFLTAAAATGDSNAVRKLGCVHTLMHEYEKGAEAFRAAVENDPRSMMSHQNYAAGYNPSTYRPDSWELKNAGELLIYDNLIQLGENFYHQGRYEDTLRCYQAALDHQDALAKKWSIPDALVRRIAAASGNFKSDLPIRLLGYEWVTLIGHIGFIDCHLRMAEIGLLPRANYVLLAPRHKVVNGAFLSLLAPHLCIVEDPALIDALLPYQRLVGDQFIAVRGKGPLAEPWAHAAARAQIACADAKQSPMVAIQPDLRERGLALLRKAGVTADWFVALHVREGGYHGDGPGTNREHRSAKFGDYLDAIGHISSRGGAVVRLGDKTMTPLKGLPGLFDYARSDIKSAEMDLFLCAEAHLFIGTTSGLTSAVQALGTPMLLVNCISNDCQFWHDRTDFIPRMVYDRRARRYLSLRETYRQPLQALLIDTALLAHRGLEIHGNQPEDILAAVSYKLDCLEGKTRPLRDGGDLLERYRTAIAANPFNFGAALPVPAFLERYPELLDCSMAHGSR